MVGFDPITEKADQTSLTDFVSFIGIYFVIAVYTAAEIIRSPTRHRSGKNVLLGWVTATFVVQMIYYVGGAKWSEIEFVESTVDPGIFAGQLSSRLAILKDTSYTVLIWLADGFIVRQISLR